MFKVVVTSILVQPDYNSTIPGKAKHCISEWYLFKQNISLRFRYAQHGIAEVMYKNLFTVQIVD